MLQRWSHGIVSTFRRFNYSTAIEEEMLSVFGEKPTQKLILSNSTEPSSTYLDYLLEHEIGPCLSISNQLVTSLTESAKTGNIKAARATFFEMQRQGSLHSQSYTLLASAYSYNYSQLKENVGTKDYWLKVRFFELLELYQLMLQNNIKPCYLFVQTLFKFTSQVADQSVFVWCFPNPLYYKPALNAKIFHMDGHSRSESDSKLVTFDSLPLTIRQLPSPISSLLLSQSLLKAAFYSSYFYNVDYKASILFLSIFSTQGKDRQYFVDHLLKLCQFYVLKSLSEKSGHKIMINSESCHSKYILLLLHLTLKISYDSTFQLNNAEELADYAARYMTKIWGNLPSLKIRHDAFMFNSKIEFYASRLLPLDEDLEIHTHTAVMALPHPFNFHETVLLIYKKLKCYQQFVDYYRLFVASSNIPIPSYL